MSLPILSMVVILLVHSAAPFSWKTCDKTDSIRIDSLSVTQKESGIVQIKGHVDLTSDIAAPIKGKLVVRKKMFWGWTTVPCIDNIGSCTFDDVCSLSPYTDPCPEELRSQGLPCKCPLLKGSYSGSVQVDLKTTQIPSWLEKGSYRVQANLERAGSSVLCVQFEIKLK